MKIKRYGYRRGLLDFRDLPYVSLTRSTLPDSVDLRPQMPPVWDQGELGSCTSHAILAAVQHRLKADNPTAHVIDGSRLAHYYMERAFEGTESIDNGAEIRDGIKIVLADGVVPESDWPYDISKFTERPPQTLYHKALDYKVTQYQSILQDGSSYHIRHALAEGLPIIIGFSVFESFESNAVAQSGIVPMPQRSEKMVGGHAVLIVGYQDRQFIVRNSWGSVATGNPWGLNGTGYCLMPADYLTDPNMASDLWVIKKVQAAENGPLNPNQ